MTVEFRALSPAVGRSAAALLALASLTAGVLIGREGLDTVVGCGPAGDAYPSRTAADWKAGADHVVVARPTSERETNRESFDKGPVRYTVDRSVTLRREKVLWSAAPPRHEVGNEFEMNAPGWSVYRSGKRIKGTAPQAPRLEIGHTYVLALRWDDGLWVVLGEGAAVPFDDHVVGRGEWCGRVLSEGGFAEGERFSRQDDHSLEEAVLGQGEHAISRELG
ncbi:hypothetical protein [Streptomyces coelicoflavus]|uniref:Uncharacterized protein n=1 Tax=Streptomyces coelicoflavus TaxID=285562 RepID=A0A6N9UHY5_9ACTN|nr:hypothetical protein [Streptomyces coelicoflavus]NEB15880.1 hypothetical protein [Streptomyces coelicoflavus]